MFKLKLWHLMPLALIALIAVAAFVWTDRSSFSRSDIVLEITGPQHIESGQVENFTIKITNNSHLALEDVDLFIDLPSALTLGNNQSARKEHFERIESQSIKEVEISITSSVAESRESIKVRLDYSPSGLDARFVGVMNHEVTIGNLDVSVIFDIPYAVSSGQEIRGTIHIVPNSDIEISPVYLRLDLPEGFDIEDTNVDFDSGTIWKLGSLKKGDDIKREFVGTLSSGEEDPKFILQVGKFDGIAFFPLKVVERSLAFSSSPILLSLELLEPQSGQVSHGDEVTARITYTNKSQEAIENATLEVRLTPSGSVAFSSVVAGSAIIDSVEERIEWNKVTTPSLRHFDVDESASVEFSFVASPELVAQMFDASSQIINIEATLTADKDNFGGVIQEESILVVRFNTSLELDQTILRNGGLFSNIGPIPPKVGELTTYDVKWSIENSLNQVRSARVEAVLPSYAQWIGIVRPSNEDVQFFPSSNTVVWNTGIIDRVGIDFLLPPRFVEFQIGVVPREDDRGRPIVIINETKLTGVDTLTNNFLEQDIGEVNTTLPDDSTIDLGEGIVQ